MLETLREAGLTESESKVYLTLLERGALTKSPLVKHANISPSKVYEVVDKLSKKGMVSVVLHNGVQTFSAAPPIKIKEYLQNKRSAIAQAEKQVDGILPKLVALGRSSTAAMDINVFTGWEGIGSAITQLALQIKPKSTLYSIGASGGSESKRTERFFLSYVNMLMQKKINIHVIFKADARPYSRTFLERYPKSLWRCRYLFTQSVAEVTVAENTVLIISLEKDPFVIRIVNQQCADLFKQYFQKLWELGEE